MKCNKASTPWQDKEPLFCQLPKSHKGPHLGTTDDGQSVAWRYDRHQTCSFCATTDSLLTNLQRVAPMPWYLDQSNSSGVCVKDATGETVFFEDFGSIPDEMPTNIADAIRERATALALFLVDVSYKQAMIGTGAHEVA